MESLVSTRSSWAFRIDFRTGERWTLDTDRDSIQLSKAGNGVVTIRSLAPGLPLSRQDMMTVEGLGYESRKDAEREAKRWRDALALFSVVSGATVDFGTGGQRSAGDRKTDMYNSPEGRIAFVSTGMTIYRPDVTLQFASVTASLSAAYPLDQFKRDLFESFTADADLNEDLFAACTLYNSSMLADIQSVRLVLLVTAVECLSDQASASDPAKLMIADLISQVQ
ncbi:hypothetical protein [Leifsonia sp. fls2-241-R2A-40a]|uniref:hypothetical protein n=1 Tax=Leifsonia sp. fls2-241-R2A-40a TaxID=3040290 RepID=UPI00254D7485|nr:hypothetical protein [Leifsonia sp. fls2-241-R2A-40a]